MSNILSATASDDETKKPLDSQGKQGLFDNRGDKTAIELFLAGTRALAFESHCNDTLRLIFRTERRDFVS
jgi:hypothetical protein